MKNKSFPKPNHNLKGITMQLPKKLRDMLENFESFDSKHFRVRGNEPTRINQELLGEWLTKNGIEKFSISDSAEGLCIYGEWFKIVSVGYVRSFGMMGERLECATLEQIEEVILPEIERYKEWSKTHVTDPRDHIKDENEMNEKQKSETVVHCEFLEKIDWEQEGKKWRHGYNGGSIWEDGYEEYDAISHLEKFYKSSKYHKLPYIGIFGDPLLYSRDSEEKRIPTLYHGLLHYAEILDLKFGYDTTSPDFDQPGDPDELERVLQERGWVYDFMDSKTVKNCKFKVFRFAGCKNRPEAHPTLPLEKYTEEKEITEKTPAFYHNYDFKFYEVFGIPCVSIQTWNPLTYIARFELKRDGKWLSETTLQKLRDEYINK